MGSRQIVLVSTAGFSVLNTGIFWREAKTKRLFSQCIQLKLSHWQFSVFIMPTTAGTSTAAVRNADSREC
jgi:hypothetical protein